MNRLANDVVDAAVKQRQRVFERRRIADGDDRCHRPVADRARQGKGAVTLADQKRLDRVDIRICRRIHPLAELLGIEARRGNSFTPEEGRIAVLHEFSIINHYDHSSASESVWHRTD
ncbi:hypothetical protein D3C86_1791880 [compost metagenome]